MLCPSRPGPSRRRGVAAVEFALLLPLLCFLFVVAVDFARVFYMSLTVANCARIGAVYGSQKPATAMDQDGIRTVAKKDVGTLDAEKLTVTSSVDNVANPTKLTVTASYTFSTVMSYPGVASHVVVTRTVRMNVTPLMAN